MSLSKVSIHLVLWIKVLVCPNCRYTLYFELRYEFVQIADTCSTLKVLWVKILVRPNCWYTLYFELRYEFVQLVDTLGTLNYGKLWVYPNCRNTMNFEGTLN